MTLVIGDDDEVNYPINTLRNIALKEASTKYVLIIDADFQPCPDFQRRFDDAILRHEDTSKFAFVAPAFEYLEMPKVISKNSRFLSLLRRVFFTERGWNSNNKRRTFATHVPRGANYRTIS